MVALVVLARSVASLAVLVLAYVFLPTEGASTGVRLGWLAVEMVVFAAIVAAQVWAILRASYPVLRAVESLVVLVPVFLLIFARVYLASSTGDPSAFSQPLDRVTALYFCVTVFATVGFGDIVASTDSMRLLVTLQMMLNLVVLGGVIRLVTVAARRGVSRRRSEPLPGEGP